MRSSFIHVSFIFLYLTLSIPLPFFLSLYLIRILGRKVDFDIVWFFSVWDFFFFCFFHCLFYSCLFSSSLVCWCALLLLSFRTNNTIFTHHPLLFTLLIWLFWFLGICWFYYHYFRLSFFTHCPSHFLGLQYAVLTRTLFRLCNFRLYVLYFADGVRVCDCM